jgi:hypothetical protein
MAGVLETLFGSVARVKVLSLFLQDATSELYLREIAQKTGLALRRLGIARWVSAHVGQRFPIVSLDGIIAQRYYTKR